ncbi:hypothetical protein [Streptomyces sp. NPDC096132]|uniref:hypothetical protein n=1 Tax=Streptomyces sp. NPDC096132 TaxID=3366075 RepID=UPI0038042902
MRAAPGLSVVGTAPAVGAAVTAHAASAAADPAAARTTHTAYTSGSSDTDVPADAKPAQTAEAVTPAR